MSNNKRVHSSRFGAAPFVTKEPLNIVLGGLGGVGAYVAFFLSRLQHNLYCYEFDVVEDVNLDSQLFPYGSIGRKKADVVAEFCKTYSNNNLHLFGKFEEGSFIADYCFAMFDNMHCRKMMFENWCESTSKELFIDTRLQAEEFQVFCVKNTPEDIERYRASLKNDDEIEELPCTYKQTGHYAAMVATQAVALFTNYLANKHYMELFGEELRELPFFNNFDGTTWKFRH